MKKVSVILFSALMLIPLAACSLFYDEEQEPVGADLQTAAITFDFSNGSPQENLMAVTHYACTAINTEEKVSALGGISWLKFAITLSRGDEDR